MHKNHLVDHIHHKTVRSNSILHVIGVISNPVRYHSRYRLAREWIKHMAGTEHVKLTIVETAFGDRHHELQTLCNELGVDYVPLRTRSEIWIKENMINIGMRHAIIKHDAKYLAWVDADVEFRNPHWAIDTIHQLQHYPIVQPWQSSVNIGPTGNISKTMDSVGFKIHQGVSPFNKHGRYTGDPYVFGHCGYAWACTRHFWENVQGLIDFAILGSGDHHCALGCRGIYSHSVHSAMKGPFMDLCHAWQTKAMQITNGIIGHVNGRIEHHFHGSMKNRNYVGRWEILIKHKYNPMSDLRRDSQGLIYLYNKPGLEHDIRMYNRSRDEDNLSE